MFYEDAEDALGYTVQPVYGWEGEGQSNLLACTPGTDYGPAWVCTGEGLVPGNPYDYSPGAVTATAPLFPSSIKVPTGAEARKITEDMALYRTAISRVTPTRHMDRNRFYERPVRQPAFRPAQKAAVSPVALVAAAAVAVMIFRARRGRS